MHREHAAAASLNSPYTSVCLEQELCISQRRLPHETRILHNAVLMLLACVSELLEYGLHHRMPPAKYSCLLAQPDNCSLDRLLKDLQMEWQLILDMEARPAAQELLHGRCRWLTYQCVREPMAALEKHQFRMCEEVHGILKAWFPAVQCSANLESIFGDMQSAVTRSGRSDCGSLPNLMSVGIRGLENRMGNQSNAGEPVRLVSSDWQGKEINALKSKLWMPSSAPACSFSQELQII